MDSREVNIMCDIKILFPAIRALNEFLLVVDVCLIKKTYLLFVGLSHLPFKRRSLLKAGLRA